MEQAFLQSGGKQEPQRRPRRRCVDTVPLVLLDALRWQVKGFWDDMKLPLVDLACKRVGICRAQEGEKSDSHGSNIRTMRCVIEPASR